MSKDNNSTITSKIEGTENMIEEKVKYLKDIPVDGFNLWGEKPLVKQDISGLPEDLPDISGFVIDKCSNWGFVSEDNLVDMFGDLSSYKEDTDNVNFETLDFNIYNEDYYAKKFPNFPPSMYPLMAQASQEKHKDLQAGMDDGIKITEGKFKVSF